LPIAYSFLGGNVLMVWAFNGSRAAARKCDRHVKEGVLYLNVDSMKQRGVCYRGNRE